LHIPWRLPFRTRNKPADCQLLAPAANNLFSVRPHPLDNNPKQAIKSKEPWPWLSALQSQKLLAQGQILQ
jgi:hypothetical protein